MYTMKESVAVAKEADAKKGVSPTKSGNSIHRVRDEPERQLGSLRDVIGNIRRDGGTPSVDSIATELSGMYAAERAPVLLALQQTHGNRYVQRVVTGIQAKLVVGQPEDVYEQEADRVADAVMQMPEPHVQRQIEEDEEEEEEEEEELIQTKPLAERIMPSVQGQVEEELQAKELSGQTPEVTSDLESRINAIRSGGQPLPASTRAFFEPRFGQDFSGVRIHKNSKAATLAKALQAKAFTAGRNIVFGDGQYAPETVEGRRLLAHELSHVTQQSVRNGTEMDAIIHRMPLTLQHRYPALDPEAVDAYLDSLELDWHGSAQGPTPDEECFVEFIVSPNRRYSGPWPLGMLNQATVLGTASPVLVFNWMERSTNSETYRTLQRYPSTMRIVRRGPGRFRATVRLIDPLGSEWREPLSMEVVIRANALDTQVADVEAGDETLLGDEALRVALEASLNAILDACRSGVDDFVNRQFAAAIGRIGSASSSTFLTQLLGNTIWASAVFVPLATGAFVVSMTGVAISMLPSIPRNFGEASDVNDVAIAAKSYFEAIVTHLNRRLSREVATYISRHPQATFRSAKLDFLRSNFPPDYIVSGGDPGIDPTRIREAVFTHASDRWRGFQLTRLMAPSRDTTVRLQATLSLIRLARQGRIDRREVLTELQDIIDTPGNEEILRRTAEEGIRQLNAME